jgi:hypothetical protein
MKLTTLVFSLFFVACVAYGQEPINHAVVQPTVSQPMATQPGVAPSDIPHLPALNQPFVFQPMANIPHQAQQPSPRQVNVPESLRPVSATVVQPTPGDAPGCGCARH